MSPIVLRAINSVRTKLIASENEGFVWNNFDLIDVRALLDAFDALYLDARGR